MAELRLVTKPCACGTAQPPFICGWKRKTEFIIPASGLIEGDKLQCKLAFVPVMLVELLPERKKFKGRKSYIDPAMISITTCIGITVIRPNAPVMVRRVGRCGAACCDKCAREVGEDRYICRAHWDAWEQREALDQTMEAFDDH